MIQVLCECGWGVAEKLPPHYHYMAGLVEMPDGEKRWVGGALTDEQREFIHMEVTWDKDQARAAIEAMGRDEP